MNTTFWQAFPALTSINDRCREKLVANAKELHVPKRTPVFRAGEQCENYFFVVRGSVRVSKIAGNGREILLYRVEGGGTCVLTTSCLLANDPYPAIGVTETDVYAFTLSASVFHETIALSNTFRAFVFASFGERLSDLITLVEAVALRRADVRLAQRLLALIDKSGVVCMTHHELASELGTAREVVSRLLKGFETEGYVQLGRSKIEITNHSALEKLIATDE